jgi:hypothetical protein
MVAATQLIEVHQICLIWDSRSEKNRLPSSNPFLYTHKKSSPASWISWPLRPPPRSSSQLIPELMIGEHPTDRNRDRKRIKGFGQNVGRASAA